jgi:hypothetical protein
MIAFVTMGGIYYITDPKAAADNLAAVSTQYFNYLDSTVNNDPNWTSNPTLIDYTRLCLLHAARYDRGLADYVTR